MCFLWVFFYLRVCYHTLVLNDTHQTIYSFALVELYILRDKIKRVINWTRLCDVQLFQQKHLHTQTDTVGLKEEAIKLDLVSDLVYSCK